MHTNVLQTELSDCYFSNKRVHFCKLCLGVAEMQLYAQLTQYSSLGVIHHEEERHTQITQTKAL